MEEQLNITVLQEKRPVTFKSLARTHGIHVNTAKQALWDYAQNTPNVHAIYCIAGRLITDSNTDTIRLVKDLDLEEAKKQFRYVTGVHVYSVIPYDPMDLSVLVTANKEIPYLTIQGRIRCGVLECSKALESKPTKQSTPAKSTPPPPPPSKPSTPAAISEPVKATSPPASSAKKSTPTKKKGTLSFGNHAVKTRTPSPQVQVQEKKPTPEPKKPALQASDIFSDDEDMTEPSPVRDPEPTPEEPMEEDLMDMDDEPAAPVQEQPSEPQEAVSSPKKRPLEPDMPTAKEYTDDSGFWVTEPAGPPKRETSKAAQPPPQRTTPKPSPTPAKKAPAKKGPGNQASLLSLWGKKKN